VAAGSFNTLVAASQGRPGGHLNGTQQYTVFAPTDQAFDAAAAALLARQDGDGPRERAVVEQLTQVLVYHVAQATVARRASSPRPGQMLDGNFAPITSATASSILPEPNLATDIIASNGSST